MAARLADKKRPLPQDIEGDDDESKEWTAELPILDGLTYAWQAHLSDKSKKYHGAAYTIRFTEDGSFNAAFDWESAPRHLSIGEKGSGFGRAPPEGSSLLVLKVVDGFKWRGGWSQMGRQFEWRFNVTDPDAVPDPTMGPLVMLDAAGKLEAEKARKLKALHPKAFEAFLDACGGGLSVSFVFTDVSNKATYVQLKVTTPGGSVFCVDARMGGVFMSERRMRANAKSNLAKFLKELHALGQANTMSAGTYSNVSLDVAGADLTINHEGFELVGNDLHEGPDGEVVD